MKNALITIALVIATTGASADQADECWKMLKPFVANAKVKHMNIVDVMRRGRRSYQSINFTLDRKVPIWQTSDWDSALRNQVSCELANGKLTHPYGSLSEMRANQSRVKQEKQNRSAADQARFK